MEVRVKDLKIGAQLDMGMCKVHSNRESTHAISWCKASDECDFIAKYVVAIVSYDAREPENPEVNFRTGGNPDYNISNIMQYLNSSEDAGEWYAKMHPYDTAPNGRNSSVNMIALSGFLSGFKSYETKCIDCVRLPTTDEIANTFPLFKRAGKRAHPSDDLQRIFGMGGGSFVSYWMNNTHGSNVDTMSRDGSIRGMRPYMQCGLRPVVRIKEDTVLECMDSYFVIKPSEEERTIDFTNDDLMRFLGVL